MRQTYFSDDYVESHRRAFNDARSQVIRWQDALARDPQNYELRQRLEHAEQSVRICAIRETAIRAQNG